MPIRASIRMQNEGPPADVRDSARFHFSLCPRRTRGFAAFVFSAAHHAATPSTCAVSATATHSGLRPRDETASHTPWWLLLLRLSIAACLILAMAGPVLNPLAAGTQTGPLLIVLDNGWPAAPGWERRIAAAARQNRGGQAKFAARSHRRDVGGRPRHRAHRGGQGARSLAGTQTRTIHP